MLYLVVDLKLALAHVAVTLVMAPGASAWFRVGNSRSWATEW